jgi:endonuclease/exonuclease/phosphatase family metal-dependent hydrolase
MRLVALCLSVAVLVTGFHLEPAAFAADTALRRLRVLTWDVNAGRSASGGAGLEAQLDAIWTARPDVVAIQHVTPGMPSLVESGLEGRSGRAWTAISHFNTDATGAVGAMVLTWLPVDASAATRLTETGAPSASRVAAAVRVQVTVNSWPVCVAAARLDQEDASNRALQLQELQGWLAAEASRRVIVGDFGAEPGDSIWPAWRAAYQDVWQVLVFNLTQESGWTIDSRPASGQPGRTDYQWYAQVTPTEVFLNKSAMSTHHALVADYEVR